MKQNKNFPISLVFSLFKENTKLNIRLEHYKIIIFEVDETKKTGPRRIRGVDCSF